MSATTLSVLVIILLFCDNVRGIDDAFKPDNPSAEFEFGALVDSGTMDTNSSIKTLGLQDIVIVARTQANSYHKKKAKRFYEHIMKQLQPEETNNLIIKMLHEDWAPFGSWTIFPLLTSLNKDYSESKSWVFFCEEDTIIDVQRLVKVLQRYDPKQSLFLGHAIQDTHPAIIHHFAFADDLSQFSFPDFSAGWAISTALLKQLSSRIEKKPLGSPDFTIDIQHEPLETDFSIDVQHEIAMYIRNEGQGIAITDVPELCTTKPGENELCVTSFNNTPEDCGNLSMDDIFFAVKTTKKYHQTRVPYVQKTLGQHAKHLVYYSETEDPSIPTENIGVPNTEMGHCAKLQAIIELSEKDKRFADKSWVVVVDDDTIMSATRLQRLLSCYDPNEVTLLGERYGYGLPTGFGYEYITGGGGMVLSRAGVKELLKSGCSCWQIDSPDDMWLGHCFRNLNVPITNSPAFHQARPIEYVPSLLAHQTPVSFHKHYEIDPMAVYRDYLS